MPVRPSGAHRAAWAALQCTLPPLEGVAGRRQLPSMLKTGSAQHVVVTAQQARRACRAGAPRLQRCPPADVAGVALHWVCIHVQQLVRVSLLAPAAAGAGAAVGLAGAALGGLLQLGLPAVRFPAGQVAAAGGRWVCPVSSC